MKKKFLSLLFLASITVGAFAGCSSNTAGTADSAKSSSSADGTEAASSAEDGQVSKADDDKKITVAATLTPHSEILEKAKEILAAEGYTLEVSVFEDYVQPNNVVESKQFDANYFQHVNYLNSFNEENNTHLIIAENGKIHYEPFGIYGGTKKDLSEIAKGDTIAVPNDTTNEARALLLLQQEGLIKLADGAGVTATVNDIVENPNELKIVEVGAEQVSKQLASVAYGVINGNYALQAGLNVEKDALAVEEAQGEAIQQYVNVIAVLEGNESSEKIAALTAALKSPEIVEYINSTYEGAVVPYTE